jgi:ribose transport system ATP-binding protein
VLQVQGITKRFGGVLALSDVGLSIWPGEIVALIGENGAGKSTLMKILGGIHQPDDGWLRVDGQEVRIGSVKDAGSYGIGLIHQEPNVLDNLDIAANIFLGREPLHGGVLRLIDRKRLHTDAARYLGRLGMRLPTDTPVRELPIAYRQMVELAKALALEARVLLMDEPTSSMTITETQRLMAVVSELRERGVSIVYISHRLSEVKEIADRVVALRDGRNAGELGREEIEHDRMVKMMVGRDLIHRRPSTARTPAPCLAVRELHTAAYPTESVSFAIRAGEVVGFAGLIGAGRTELARALFGIDAPLAGTIELNGTSLRIGSPLDAIREGILLVPEDRRLSGCIPSMTVRENLTLPTLRHYVRGALIDFGLERTEAERLRSAFSVKCSGIEQRVAELSGGNQQKVVLAKWLALTPKVIILDEPTRGVDVGAKAEIYEFIRKLAASGVAVMLISSDMEEILGESHRVIVMHEGALVGTLDREECSEEAILQLAVGHRQLPATDVVRHSA